jgi:tyrosinase
MVNPTLSPGDPVFYLHHSYLDKLWWDWQNLETSRLLDMGGPNIPTNLDEEDPTYPGPEYTDYFGDGGGNVTTLYHTLFMAGLAQNVTIAEIMDIRSAVMCTEYL